MPAAGTPERSRPPDAVRVLIYMVLYWEREWKAYEDHHAPGESLKLTPVLPIVFHTGPEPWRAQRKLRDLMNGPEEVLTGIPDWQTIFWDLAECTPEQLLQKEGACRMIVYRVAAFSRASRSGRLRT